jgi:hypothetical protein
VQKIAKEKKQFNLRPALLLGTFAIVLLNPDHGTLDMRAALDKLIKQRKKRSPSQPN